MTQTDLPPPPRVRRVPYVPAVGPRLKKLLGVVLALFGLLAIDGLYLVSVKIAEAVTGETLQNLIYQYAFLVHLALGLLFIAPFVIFGVVHIRNAHNRPNRRAVRAGYALFGTGVLVILSGIVLTRIEGLFVVKDASVRSVAYWAHVLTPFVAVWLFILHRLAGPPIRWRGGLLLGGAGAAFALGMVLLHAQDPRKWNVEGNPAGKKYFFPSLAMTATGDFIPARTMMMDQYCKECHADVHEDWSHSVHRFSSFNNPAYLFSVRETREVAMERDGNVKASRWCAGCHDPAPFFSGAFDDPEFDDENHPTAHAGITCTACHAITNVNSVKGNSDYTIDVPIHYPFTFSDNPFLQWVNRQLIKAKPDFHKKTFLKPLHRTPEFCGTCHKVHIPPEVNDYKFLRGQNHYDAYHVSGVSGHGITSFYYPPKAEHNCNGCHMPPQPSDDFAARPIDDSGELQVHDHQFPSANTAIPHLVGMPEEVNDRHREFLKGSLRVDIFGLKEGGTIEGELHAPLRPEEPELVRGRLYLLETVVRTLELGHLFTQGTIDSNQVWLDVTVRADGQVIGRSGGREEDGVVDPWSYFLNAYVLDREGNRIDRRNPQDIFTKLYDHQIPPGAASVVHYRLRVPEEVSAPVTVDVALQYRKFDTKYMRYVYGEDYVNDLPTVTIATDSVTLPVQGSSDDVQNPSRDIPTWQRWNDYGIALLLEGSQGARKGELRQAEAAFRQVGELGRPDGPMNRARVYIKEGRLDEAVDALREAAEWDPPARPWSVAWFTGLVNFQNGHLDKAIENLRAVVETRFEDARERGFDFGQDYRALNRLAQVLFERGKQERGSDARGRRNKFFEAARRRYEEALQYDPENVEAHWGLAQVYARLGNAEEAERHEAWHREYKPDDNARDRAVTLHRLRNPAADHAAESIVIYDLQRPGAPGLEIAASEGKETR